VVKKQTIPSLFLGYLWLFMLMIV